MLQYEVYSVVEGAADETIWTDDADAAAARLANELTAAAAVQGFEDWQVYVLPHYCQGDDECTCAQYLPSHHPVYSSE